MSKNKPKINFTRPLSYFFQDLERLPNSELIIELLVEIIKQCALSIDRHDYRYKIDVELENNKVSSVHQIRRNGLCISTIEVLNSVYFFCHNETIRQHIFRKYYIKEDLKKIILHGKSTEVEFALKLMLQFCFDEKLVDEFKEDAEFIQMIKSIFTNNDPNDRIINYCKGIKFIINNKRLESDSFSNSMKTIKKIFISHDHKDMDICFKIGEKLKEFDFKIWFINFKVEHYDFDVVTKALKSSDCIMLSKNLMLWAYIF